MTGSLDVLREFTGADGPELVVAVQATPVDRVTELADAILDRAPAQAAAPPPRSQVWPVVTMRASTFASGGVYRDAAGLAGVNLNAAMNPRLVGTGRFSDGVLRALLYSHGLVIEDPVGAAAEMMQGTRAELREVAKLAVTAATSAIVEIAPLLDAGVIRTFFMPSDQQAPVSALGSEIAQRLAEPTGGFTLQEAWDAFESAYVDGLSPGLQQLWRRIRSGDKSPPLSLVEQGIAEGDVEVVETFIKVLSELKPQAVIDNAADMVASAVLTIEELGGFYDLLCPSPLFAKMLFVGARSPDDAVRLHELARVDVPGIVEISAHDAVLIRQSNDAFDRWRNDLTVALTQAHNLRADGTNSEDAAAVMREAMADARIALHREARRSKVLSTANLVSYVAGALGGMVAGAPGGRPGSSYGAAGGTLTALVQAVLSNRRVPRFVDRHYIVFEPRASLTPRP